MIVVTILNLDFIENLKKIIFNTSKAKNKTQDDTKVHIANINFDASLGQIFGLWGIKYKLDISFF